MTRTMLQGPVQLYLALVAGVATAPALADPMRPLGAASASTAAASPGPAPNDAQATGASTTPVRKLLAIRQENSGERAALWGDRWLRAGDRYTAPEGETVVLAIGSHHIELEQGTVKSTQYLLAPLLPPQWPLVQATAASATARTPNSTSPKSTPARPSTASATPPAATAPRTERP